MGRSATRYCAKGERCTQYQHLGAPAKLRNTSEGDICERCKEADTRDSAGLPRRDEPQRRRYDLLETSAGKEIKALKSDLVLQLYKRNGPFFEAVRQVRERWNIEPEVSFPPQPVYAELLPPGMAHQPPKPSLWEQYSEWQDTYERWIRELESVARTAIPLAFIGEEFRPDWGSFISVCVLFQPAVSADSAKPKLREFAEIGGPKAHSLPLKPGKNYPGGPLMAVKPPIRVMDDPAEEARIEALYGDAVVRSIWEIYIKSSGVSLDEMLARVHRDHPEIEQERSEGLSQNRDTQAYWIRFDENVRVKDPQKYVRMITEAQGQEMRPSQGAPSALRLEYVECAELRVRHRWDIQKLAKYYDVSEDTVKWRIRVGRKELGNP